MPRYGQQAFRVWLSSRAGDVIDAKRPGLPMSEGPAIMVHGLKDQAMMLVVVPVASACMAAPTCALAPVLAAAAAGAAAGVAAGAAGGVWLFHAAIAALEPPPLTRIPICRLRLSGCRPKCQNGVWGIDLRAIVFVVRKLG